MIRRDDNAAIVSSIANPMTELRARTPSLRGLVGIGEDPPARVVRNSAEGDVHAQVGQCGKLSDEMRLAGGNLRRRGHVVGWRAPHGGRDPRVLQCEAVVGASRRRLIRQAVGVEGGHEEIARSADAVSGEVAACPVGAVGRGSEPDDARFSPPDRRSRQPDGPSRCRCGRPRVSRGRCAGNSRAAADSARRW